VISDAATRRRDELHDGLVSMTPAELRDATRRALLTVYSPQQTAIWLNAHASGDPLVVARKALRLCGVEPAGAAAVADTGVPTPSVEPHAARRDVSDAANRRSLATGHAITGRHGGPRRSRGGEPGPARAHRELDAQRVVTDAVRALLSCRCKVEVRTVLVEAVARLGGQVVPAEDATELTIPLDLSLGLGPRLLPTPDPERPETAEPLRTHLPELLEDARHVLERLEQDREATSAAEHDALTGLLDRRAYERLAGRVSTGDVLVLVGLDGFGPVNEVHGRLAGDQLLRLFGAVLSEQMRISEHALRLGGDEFLLVLTDPDDGAATRLLERLRIAWERRRSLPVSFSAGVAVIGGHIDRALEDADRRRGETKRDRRIDG
jgi:diguanylate cyclase (GGDEF)-like protein